MLFSLKICRSLHRFCLVLFWILCISILTQNSDISCAQEKKEQTLTQPQDLKQPSGSSTPQLGTTEVIEKKVPPNSKDDAAPQLPQATETDPKVLNSTNSPIALQLVALLTEDGQTIDKGVIWRIFAENGTERVPTEPLIVDRSPSPIVKLKPGNYIINVAFGRAHQTRRITVPISTSATPTIEKFVVNAGGLKVKALLSGKPAPDGSVSYSIYTDRDQSDERRLIVGSVKTGVVMRLNAGIYYIESIYGDANAAIRSDVTVEAGKLTEAIISHTFAKVSFKLVTRSGGDALPNTQWSIQTPEGNIVKESVGALPSHTLAPGSYTVIARNQDKAFKKEFTVKDGQNQEIEILLQ